MGAVTDIALELARDIAAEIADPQHFDDEARRLVARLSSWEIFGVWRLAMRLDPEAASAAQKEFDGIRQGLL